MESHSPRCDVTEEITVTLPRVTLLKYVQNQAPGCDVREENTSPPSAAATWPPSSLRGRDSEMTGIEGLPAELGGGETRMTVPEIFSWGGLWK